MTTDDLGFDLNATLPPLLDFYDALLTAETLEAFATNARKSARALPPEVSSLPSMLPSKGFIASMITKKAASLAAAGLTSFFRGGSLPASKGDMDQAKAIAAKVIGLRLGLNATPEKVKQAYPVERFEKDRQLLQSEGTGALFVSKLQEHENLKKTNPWRANLDAAVTVDSDYPKYDNALKHFYADVFPTMTYDDVVALRVAESSYIPSDLVFRLLDRTFDDITIKQVARLATSIIAKLPPQKIEHLLTEGTQLFSETVDYLKTTDDSVTTFPEPLAQRLTVHRAELLNATDAIWKAMESAQLEIVTHFDDVVKQTLINHLEAHPHDKSTKYGAGSHPTFDR